MKNIINFSCRHPISVIMCTIAVVLLGILCLLIIPVDFLPTISEDKILVITRYEGITAQDIRSLVTIPLEDAFASLKGLKTISSVSRDSISLLTIQLHRGTDISMSLIDARQIIDGVFHTLPSDCEKSIVQRVHTSQQETLTLALIPKDGDLLFARHIAEVDIKPRIQRLPGISLVSISGGLKEQIEVQVNKDSLEAKKLNLELIANTISLGNFDYPAGSITEGNKELLVTTTASFTNAEQIAKTILSFGDEGFLRISDIGEVIYNHQTQESFFLHDGREGIKIIVSKKHNASPLSVSKTVRNNIAEIGLMYNNLFDLKVVEDVSVQMKRSISSLVWAAILGVCASSFVIVYFLRSKKIACVLATLIPLSVLTTIIVLRCTGKTLNVLSLSGMAIGIGMVVDCGVIVLENIQNHFARIEHTLIKKSLAQKMIVHVISQATEEVSLSGVGSTLTTVVVFIPVFFINGIIGELFIDLAIAVIACILASCLFSFTFIPAVFVANYATSHKSCKLLAYTPFLYKKIEILYERAIRLFLKKKVYTCIIIVLCIVIGFISALCLRYEMLPTINDDSIHIEMRFTNTARIEYIKDVAFDIHKELSKLSFIKKLSILGGIEKDDYTRLASYDALQHSLLLYLQIKNPPKNYKEILKNVLDRTGCTYRLDEKNDILARLLNLQGDVHIIQAENPDILLNESKKITSHENTLLPQFIVNEWVFSPNRMNAAHFGVSPLSLAILAEQSLNGVSSLPFYNEGREVPVIVTLQPSSIRSISQLEQLSVQVGEQQVPLGSLGHFSQNKTEKVLFRYNKKDSKVITGEFKYPSESDVRVAIFSIKEIEKQELFGDSILLLFIVVLLLYVVLGAQFESFTIPLFILAALPPAFSGSLFFLAVFGKTLTLNTIIALVVLFGAAVNNAIILYEKTIRLPQINQNTLILISKEKLRPILITTLTTIFALIPFAFDPFNQHAQSSLSLALIGGLIFSTVLVLCFMPIVFSVTLKKGEE